MKVGILTYHRSHNFGALLQAVATRVILQKLGHEVYYVDYFPEYHQEMYKYISWQHMSKLSTKGKISYLVNSIKNFPYKKERKKRFNSFIRTNISPYCKPLTDNFDVIVYGSDQIWRKQKALDSINSIYFGGVIKAEKHISFAASMGVIDLNESQKTCFKKYLANLNTISVREKDLQELIISLGFTTVYRHIDPTLCLPAEVWDKIIPIKKEKSRGYLLYYNLYKESFNENAIYEYAKRLGLLVIAVSGTAKGKSTPNNRTTVGPDEFINLIRGAEFVITSSFHGLAFSIIYHKPFITSFRHNAGRAQSLLSDLGLLERLVPAQCKELPMLNDIDYKLIEEKINNSRNAALDYLKRECTI